VITLWELLSLWWFFCEEHVLGPMLWILISLHLPLSFLLVLDQVSFHSFMVFFLLSFTFGPLNHFTYLFSPLCTLRFQSFSCVFCARQMLSILTAHSSHMPNVFDLFHKFSTHIMCFQSSSCTRGAFDFLCMFFPCALCFWSFMHVLFMYLVLLIFFTHSLRMSCALNPLYACLVLCLLFLNISSLNPLRMRLVLCFMSLNNLSSLSFLHT
jgi:hypothetical protein